jgi:hypothetical protein
LAKRSTDGLICRLLLIALVLVVVALATMIVFWSYDWPVAVGDWAFVSLCVFLAFGSAQVVSERRVDEVNALARLASTTILRNVPLVALVVVWDLFWRPAGIRSIVALLLVEYASALAASVWLISVVLKQSAGAAPRTARRSN